MGNVKVFVVALPGSGKSTTLSKLSEIMPEVKVINFGDLMYEEAKKTYGINHRDDMRRLLNIVHYRELQVRAAKRIAAMQGIVVVDTHSIVKTPWGFYPGLPSEVVRIVRPDAVIHLEYRPEDILKRRRKDADERKREEENTEEIENDQRISRQFAVAAANEAMAYLLILSYCYEQQYPYQHAEEAAKEIANIVRTLSEKKNGT
ncbi:MAG TPA: adenylate kinase [Candidatus Caldiarchaeum subterraneum]|uniref:Adenylate kinase n=1 Tax=Caldiarchaeum subterraneum TaxID=311458 RepID=A0A832ZYE2_CALS0|nr:adenylate kinase [Candidatus Caldarchaeum subterraneum]